MCALVPVWALLAPIMLGLFLGYVAGHSTTISSYATALICIVLLGILAMGIVLTAFTEDDRIYVSKDGMAFPLFLLPLLKFKRNRSWSELRHADLEMSDKGDHVLRLHYDNAVVPVNLENISESDREQMLLAVELWGSGCQRSPALIEYQNALQDEIRGLDKLSYTQMWEEELGRRFTATSFVPLEPGAKLKGGELQVVKQLAFGGLSAIYEAQHHKTGPLVIKEAVIPANAESADRQSAEARIEKESRILIKLDHPGIAKVLDYFVDDGRHYLCLEYVNGQDLRQLVKQNGPQPEDKVLDWAKQVAKIVQYLHSQDPPIIHRDLTPDNLVLRKDGEVTLIDFGAANEFIGQATGTLVGKQAYMSPEQLRGKASIQSDLYSFGGTLYFLLVGRDPKALMPAEPRKALPSISEEMDRLVFQLTQFETEQRTKSAEELSQALLSMHKHAGQDTVSSGDPS